jgi:hypothetical protein
MLTCFAIDLLTFRADGTNHISQTFRGLETVDCVGRFPSVPSAPLARPGLSIVVVEFGFELRRRQSPTDFWRTTGEADYVITVSGAGAGSEAAQGRHEDVPSDSKADFPGQYRVPQAH